MTSPPVVANDAEAPPPASALITLPIVLIALLKFENFGVQLNRARDGSSTWFFRFAPRAVLEMRDDGAWCWQRGSGPWRARIEPFVARAEAMLAAEAPGRHSDQALRRINFA